jgi:phosphotransferase system  glucose/maltose/N-acetylglucosamine-specific IIC component
MNDFLTFRRMITPVVIQVLFWLGVIATVIYSIVTARRQPIAILGVIIGPFIVRIYCEILIVLFRINETLTDIRQNTARDQ